MRATYLLMPAPPLTPSRPRAAALKVLGLVAFVTVLAACLPGLFRRESASLLLLPLQLDTH